jgi:hypothetical protein
MRRLSRQHNAFDGNFQNLFPACLNDTIGWRTDVVRVVPQTASLYAAIGLRVNLRGLSFSPRPMTACRCSWLRARSRARRQASSRFRSSHRPPGRCDCGSKSGWDPVCFGCEAGDGVGCSGARDQQTNPSTRTSIRASSNTPADSPTQA